MRYLLIFTGLFVLSATCTADEPVANSPAPITDVLPEMTPLGVWRILNVSPAATIVCPALGPPW